MVGKESNLAMFLTTNEPILPQPHREVKALTYTSCRT
jgi:hypothetical protein